MLRCMAASFWLRLLLPGAVQGAVQECCPGCCCEVASPGVVQGALQGAIWCDSRLRCKACFGGKCICKTGSPQSSLGRIDEKDALGH